MTYKIIKDFPPNIEEIRKVFSLEGHNPVFTYGNKIYSPHSEELPDHLIEHEKVHITQQQEYNKDKWWSDYLTEPEFRLRQELQAYIAQYKYIAKTASRQMRRAFARRIARDLSSNLYGNIITYDNALKQIQD